MGAKGPGPADPVLSVELHIDAGPSRVIQAMKSLGVSRGPEVGWALPIHNPATSIESASHEERR